MPIVQGSPLADVEEVEPVDLLPALPAPRELVEADGREWTEQRYAGDHGKEERHQRPAGGHHYGGNAHNV